MICGRTKYGNKHSLYLIKRIVTQTKHDNNIIIIQNLLNIYECTDKPNNEMRDILLQSFTSIITHDTHDVLAKIEDFTNVKLINDIKWINALIKMYLTNNNLSHALFIYNKYKHKQKLNEISHIYAIKACINMNDYSSGQLIINELPAIYANKQPITISNILINFYGHFGNIENAIYIFENSKNKDIVTMNSMMKMYIDNKMYTNALQIYDSMNELLLNDISHVLAIKACSNSDEYNKGLHIIGASKLENIRNTRLQNTLISFYGRFSKVKSALNVFNNIIDTDKTIQSCNAMMSVYCDNNLNDECIQLFTELSTKYKFRPSVISYIIGIKAYSNIKDILSAEILFNKVTNKTIECINCMMRGYIQNDLNEKALNIYDKYSSMHSNVSHLLAIKACANSKVFDKGHVILNAIKMDENIMCDINIKNAIIDFYGKYGDIIHALNIFNSINDDEKDIISVNSIMTVYLENECYTECIQMFEWLKQFKNLKPNAISYAIIFKVCTQGTIYQYGQIIHDELKNDKNKFDILNNISIQINLIYFYGKCGKMDICKDILNSIKYANYNEYCNNLDIWNAMIHSFGRNGNINVVMNIYNKMKQETCFEINYKIHTSLINAFNHCGQVNKAIYLWQNEINSKYNKYTISAFIDCLSRNGYLDNAYQLLLEYENRCGIIQDPNDGQWMALLNGCKKHGNKILAQKVYNEMEKRYGKKWNTHMASASTLLANIYSLDNNQREQHG